MATKSRKAASKQPKPTSRRKLTEFQWDERRNLAAQLVAEGQQTDDQIAEQCGVSRAAFAKWKVVAEFKARVDQIVAESAEALKKEGIRLKENRLNTLQTAVDKMLDLIEARGKDLGQIQAEECESCGSLPELFIAGGATGLLVRDYKNNGITPVYKFDAALMRELREYLKHAAIEKGEWTERREHGGAVVNLDLSQLTDDQLDKFEQYLEAGETEQRAYTLARKA